MAFSGPTPSPAQTDEQPHATTINWLPICVFTALLMLLFAPVLVSMAKEWGTDEDMGHGMFVPVIAIWIAWQKRDELSKLPVKSSYWGFLFLLWGGLQLFAATLGVELFLARTAFLASL